MTFDLKITTAQQLIEQDRAKTLSDLADIRWQCAMAGVVLPGGLHEAAICLARSTNRSTARSMW